MLGEDCIFVVGLVTSVIFFKKNLDECTERSMSVGLSYTNVKQLDQATSVYRSSESGNGYLRFMRRVAAAHQFEVQAVQEMWSVHKDATFKYCLLEPILIDV